MSLASPRPADFPGKPELSAWAQVGVRTALSLVLYLVCYLLTAYAPEWLFPPAITAYLAAIIALNVWSWRTIPAGREDVSAYIIRRTLSVIGGPFTLLFTFCAWIAGAFAQMAHAHYPPPP